MTVDAPGGHVYQSRAWAEHRRATRLAAALPRRRRRRPGAGADPVVAARRRAAAPTCRAGRSRWAPTPAALGARLIAFADALAARRDRRRRRRPRGARPRTTAFRADDRGRRLPADRGDPAVAPPGHPAARAGRGRGGRLRGDRQVDPPADPRRRARRRRASSATTRASGPTAPGEGFVAPDRAAGGRPRPLLRPAARDRRAAPLLVRAAGRRSSPGGGRRSRPATSSTSRRARAAPTASRWPGSSCTATAAGSRPSTRATTPATRSDHPGALHLLRWRAIQLAIREGCTEMDLGGVDVAGARGEPTRGRPAVRAVPAQGVVRRPLARADRRPRAGLRPARLPARAASPAGSRRVVGR